MRNVSHLHEAYNTVLREGFFKLNLEVEWIKILFVTVELEQSDFITASGDK